jgi:hypothetical protein
VNPPEAEVRPQTQAPSRSRWADDAILAGMPVISIFFGIVIRMYYKEHEPQHFHAEHQAQEGKFDFDGTRLLAISRQGTPSI